jgi:uncharacterized protein (DUF305 family)
MFQYTNSRKAHRFTSSSSAIVLAAIMAIAPTWIHAAPDSKPMSGEMMNGMHMKNMSDMSMTGDVDYDFAVNMRKHHQMGIDMANAQLKHGKNPIMLHMAKDIIAAQKKEIILFDQWIVVHKPPMQAKAK